MAKLPPHSKKKKSEWERADEVESCLVCGVGKGDRREERGIAGDQSKNTPQSARARARQRSLDNLRGTGGEREKVLAGPPRAPSKKRLARGKWQGKNGTVGKFLGKCGVL